MIISSCIHVATNGIISFFLWPSSFPSYMYATFSLHGCLGCFRILALVNRAAVSIRVCVSFRLIVLPGCMPRSGMLDHMVILFLVF